MGTHKRHYHYYTHITKDKIKLAEKPFAGGGEGKLYKIASPRKYAHLVAKVYHPHKRTPKRARKMRYLLDHAPTVTQVQKDNNSLVWPKDILYLEGKFVGILMPIVLGEKLEALTLSRLPKKLSREWRRFNPKDPKSRNLRLKTCFNLAAAVYQLHNSDRYILVDLKPDNVMIKPNGILSLVDMDSVEVVENGVTIYEAPVATPEYTPPEFYRKSSEDPSQNPAWDLFSLGVIFYKLLLGIHPFAASAKPPYDKYVDLHSKIEHGLFAHSKSRASLLSVVPPPHRRFHNLPPVVKDLFIRCFEDGFIDPNLRPKAEEWCLVLADVLGLPIEHLALRKMPSSRVDVEKLVPKVDDLEKLYPEYADVVESMESKTIVLRNSDDYLLTNLKEQLKKPPQVGGANLVILGLGLFAIALSPIVGIIIIILGFLAAEVASSGSQKDSEADIIWRLAGVKVKGYALQETIKVAEQRFRENAGYLKRMYSDLRNLSKTIQENRNKPTKLVLFENNYAKFRKEILEFKKELKQKDQLVANLRDKERRLQLEALTRYKNQLKTNETLAQWKTHSYHTLTEYLGAVGETIKKNKAQIDKERATLEQRYKKQLEAILPNLEKEREEEFLDYYKEKKRKITAKANAKLKELNAAYQVKSKKLRAKHIFSFLSNVRQDALQRQIDNHFEFKKITKEISAQEKVVENLEGNVRFGMNNNPTSARRVEVEREKLQALEQKREELTGRLEWVLGIDLTKPRSRLEPYYDIRRELSKNKDAIISEKREALDSLAGEKATFVSQIDMAEKNDQIRALERIYKKELNLLEDRLEKEVRILEKQSPVNEVAQAFLDRAYANYKRESSVIPKQASKEYDQIIKSADKVTKKYEKKSKKINAEYAQEIVPLFKSKQGAVKDYNRMKLVIEMRQKVLEEEAKELERMRTVQLLESKS